MHYHRNAKTNICQRQIIKESSESSHQLASIYKISNVTVAKWKKANHLEDKSHRPNIIHYVVPKEFWSLIKKVRKFSKLPIDDLLL